MRSVFMEESYELNANRQHLKIYAQVQSIYLDGCHTLIHYLMRTSGHAL